MENENKIIKQLTKVINYAVIGTIDKLRAEFIKSHSQLTHSIKTLTTRVDRIENTQDKMLSKLLDMDEVLTEVSQDQKVMKRDIVDIKDQVEGLTKLHIKLDQEQTMTKFAVSRHEDRLQIIETQLAK